MLRLIRNFYFLVNLAFLLWILFLDTNNVFSIYALHRKLSQLKKQIQLYELRTSLIESYLEKLFSDEKELERFAREKYFFKEKGEEIFIIEDLEQK